jgi:hypothetical protein
MSALNFNHPLRWRHGDTEEAFALVLKDGIKRLVL